MDHRRLCNINKLVENIKAHGNVRIFNNTSWNCHMDIFPGFILYKAPVNVDVADLPQPSFNNTNCDTDSYQTQTNNQKNINPSSICWIFFSYNRQY